ncbi:MAG: hypothetical protein R3C97_07565 [Geminicoccaceae bacterium]
MRRSVQPWIALKITPPAPQHHVEPSRKNTRRRSIPAIRSRCRGHCANCNADDTDQSYSERQMYRAARPRLAREVAAIERVDETEGDGETGKVLLPAA